MKSSAIERVQNSTTKEQHIDTPEVRLALLEHELKDTGNRKGGAKDLFNFILYKIRGAGGLDIRLLKRKEDFSEWENSSLEELTKEYRNRLRSSERVRLFDEWLELAQRLNVSWDGKEPQEKTQNDTHAENIEAKIKLAQEEQSEIENDLARALFSRDFGLKIEVGRDKYNLPEYHIYSKNGEELGTIRFSTDHRNGEERNILEFVRFTTNDPDAKGQVLMIVSDMEKSKIEKFARATLLALVGQKSEVATAD